MSTPLPSTVKVGCPTVVITDRDGRREIPCKPVLRLQRPSSGGWIWRFGFLGLLLLVVGLGLMWHGQVADGALWAMASIVPIAFKRAMLANRAWKVALYVGAANLGNATAGYSAVNEVVGPGYAAGGLVLVPDVITGSDGITALLDFDDVLWAAATFTARYLLVYDNNLTGKEGFVIDMGSDQSVSGGTFEIQWPAADLLTAILQVA